MKKSEPFLSCLFEKIFGPKSDPRWSKSVEFEKKMNFFFALGYRGHQIAEILSDFQLGDAKKCPKSEKKEKFSKKKFRFFLVAKVNQGGVSRSNLIKT